MSLTRKQAIDEMLTVLKTAWDTTGYSGRVKYENVSKKSLPMTGQQPWARVVLRHGPSRQATLAGTVGARRFRRTGVLVVQVFLPMGVGTASGLDSGGDLSKIVSDAFEGVTTAGGVIFRNVSVNEIGQDGDWFQVNVSAGFEYDEVK